MLKLNCVLFFVILCGVLQLSCGEKLKCEFKNEDYHVVGTVYSCYVTSLDNSYDNMTIDGYTETHLANKNDKDVKAIWISGTKLKFIPHGLGFLFNLTAFLVESSQLVEIRSKDFQGMQNLLFLSLYGNRIPVPSDAFSSMKNLIFINLNHNQIKYIGSGVFDQLTNLNRVYLYGNICVNKDYNGATAITQMKENIKANCVKPNDVIQFEIEHKIRDESTRIRKENQEQFKALNEMVKQLLMESKEYKMEHQENIKLKVELSTAKAGQDEVTKERDQLMKDLTDLKKELTEAKETIDQKLPKMEQLIEDFYMEVMDLKIERHNERQNSIALRSKLMEAKEQLAECKNE